MTLRGFFGTSAATAAADRNWAGNKCIYEYNAVNEIRKHMQTQDREQATKTSTGKRLTRKTELIKVFIES